MKSKSHLSENMMSHRLLSLLGVLCLMMVCRSTNGGDNIVQVADKAGTFKTLLEAAEAAGLADTLQEDGPFTVFAPTDDAFAKLPKYALDDLLKPESQQKLATFLRYHIVNGEFSAEDAVKEGQLKTLAGDFIYLSIRAGRLAISNANVIGNDVEASNGTIHIVDSVLKHPADLEGLSDRLSTRRNILNRLVLEADQDGNQALFEWANTVRSNEDLIADMYDYTSNLEGNKELIAAILADRIALRQKQPSEASPDTTSHSTTHKTSEQKEQIVLAKAHAESLYAKEDWNAACKAYLELLRIDPDQFDYYSENKIRAAFTKADRLSELVEFFDEATIQQMGSHNRSLKDLICDAVKDETTKAAGFALLKRVFRYQRKGGSSLAIVPKSLLESKSFDWEKVPDPVYYLRSVLLPDDFEEPGWELLSPQILLVDRTSVGGLLTLIEPLCYSDQALHTFADEIRGLIKKHPKWIGGPALLAFVEAEGGNGDEAAKILKQHFIDPGTPKFEPAAAWLIGECVAGKNKALDRVLIQLLEPCVKQIANRNYRRPSHSTGPFGDDPLRISPIKTLAKLYAANGRELEARQLLYGLMDPLDQHPLVQGYVISERLACRFKTIAANCTACHRKERGLLDFMAASDAMTDVGYPVDSLLSLARIDSSFQNAFTSPSGWLPTDLEELERFNRSELNDDKDNTLKFEFGEQLAKAREAVTPGKVSEAIKINSFNRSHRLKRDEISTLISFIEESKSESDDDISVAMRKLARKLKDDSAHAEVPPLDLMVSLRGTTGSGASDDIRPEIFSPVIQILELASKATGHASQKDITELDQKLVELSARESGEMEAGIAATVFAFLRNDLDSAKDRLTQLQSVTDYPESDGIALWLAARHALRYDQTRILGEVLTERALTAAENLPDTRFREAILREHSGLCAK